MPEASAAFRNSWRTPLLKGGPKHGTHQCLPLWGRSASLSEWVCPQHVCVVLSVWRVMLLACEPGAVVTSAPPVMGHGTPHNTPRSVHHRHTRAKRSTRACACSGGGTLASGTRTD